MGSNTPTVSIIIPCYNLGKYLKDAVKSVQNQSFKNWELIIVDDGSTDTESHIVIDLLKQSHPEIRVLMQKNQGQSVARNNGIKMAAGKYIVCLDADDKLTPTFLEKCVSVIENDKSGKVAIVTTWVQEFGLRRGIWRTEEFSVPKMLITNVIHAASLFRKEVWHTVGGYKKGKISGYEDWELWLSIIEAGFVWIVIPEPLFNYRIRHNSMLSTAASKHAMKYERLYELHKKLFNDHNKEFVLEASVQLKELHTVIGANHRLLNKTASELDLLRTMRAEDSLELEKLYQSRVTKHAIKARKHLMILRDRINYSK